MTHEEPYHTTIHLQNGMRYLKLTAASGDTTAYHRHVYPILYMNLRAVNVWLESPGSNGRRAHLEKEWIGSNSYSEEEFMVHRFAIAGADTMLLIATECYDCSPVRAESLQRMVYCRDGFAVYEASALEWQQCPFLSSWPAMCIESSHFLKGALLVPGQVNSAELMSDSRSKLWIAVPVHPGSCPD